MQTNENVIARRQELRSRLLCELFEFYKKPENVEIYAQYLSRRLGRTFEWLCTQGAWHPELPELPVSMEEIHFKYKKQLDLLHKRFFDPTNRDHGDDTHIVIKRSKESASGVIEKQFMKATIGCLQFIRWAQHMKLVDYCMKNQKQLTRIRKEQRQSRSELILSDGRPSSGGTGSSRKRSREPTGVRQLIPTILFDGKEPSGQIKRSRLLRVVGGISGPIVSASPSVE